LSITAGPLFLTNEAMPRGKQADELKAKVPAGGAGK
jgi:hypothetical protein